MQSDLFGESGGGPLGIRSWKYIPIPDLPETEAGLESLNELIYSLLVRNHAFRRALQRHGIGEDATGVASFNMLDELLILSLGLMEIRKLDLSEVGEFVEGLRYQVQTLEDQRSHILSALDTTTARRVMASEPRMGVRKFDVNTRIADAQFRFSEKIGDFFEIVLSFMQFPAIDELGSPEDTEHKLETPSPTDVEPYITYIRIDGPPEAGKTTLIEHLLRLKPDHTILACRVRENSNSTEPTVQREGSGETMRYQAAGADDTVHCDYPPGQTEVMLECFRDDSSLFCQPSDALVYECNADCHLSSALCVFVASLPTDDRPLVVRGTREYLELDYQVILQALFEDPGAVRLVDLSPNIDPSLPDKPTSRRRKNKNQLSDRALAIIGEIVDRAIASPGEKEAWVLTEPFGGLAHANAVIINIRGAGEIERAIRFRREIHRIYTEWEIAEDILEFQTLYSKIPVFICNLADPDDPVLPFALRIFNHVFPEKSVT